MATILTAARLATTTNITLATNLNIGTSKIDGVLVALNDRILVKAQTNAVQNGVYVVGSAGALSRAADFANGSSQSASTIIFVQEGDSFADTGWVITSDGTLTVGTSQILFERFSVNLKLSGADVPSSIVLRSVKGYPLTNAELDNNLTYLSVNLTQKLNTADFTPTAVVQRINSLSSSQANLNAWTLNGSLPNQSAVSNTIALRDSSGGIAASNFYGNLQGNSSTSTLADYATIANNVNGIVAVQNGGTNSSTAAGARASLQAVCINGDTMNGKLTLATVLNTAPLNIPTITGVSPTLVDGDVWSDSTGLNYRLNGVSKKIAATDSPNFIGAPTAPTADVSSNSTAVATTAFVKLVKALLDADIALRATINSPAFTGIPTSVTPAVSDDSTKIATTALVAAKIASALANYSTTAEVSTQIASALGNYSTSSQVNQAIASALNNYYTKQQVDSLLSAYSNTSQTNTAISNAVSSKANTSYVDSLQDKWGSSRKYVQSTQPTNAVDGDFWFKV